MGVPYHRYLLWLCIKEESDEQIESLFDRHTIPIPTKAMIGEYRARAADLTLSGGTRRRIKAGRLDKIDAAIMTKLDLVEIYYWDLHGLPEAPGLEDDWREVESILANPVIRVAIDCALISRHSEDDLAQILPTMLNISCGKRGLVMYRRYFFEVDQMSKADWREYVRLTEDVPYVHIRYYTALTRPKDEVLHLVGIPTKPDFSSFLKNVLATADFKFKYYARHNSPGSDGQARTWAKIGFEAGVRFDKYSSSDATDFASAVQTEFALIDQNIQTIDTASLSQIKPDLLEVKEAAVAPALPPVHNIDPNNV